MRVHRRAFFIEFPPLGKGEAFLCTRATPKVELGTLVSIADGKEGAFAFRQPEIRACF